MKTLPKPMPNPCRRCLQSVRCRNSDSYKCSLFRRVFTRSWDETVAFLKAQLEKKEDTQ